MNKLAIVFATATAMIAPQWGAKIGLDSTAHAAMIVAQVQQDQGQQQGQPSTQDQQFARNALVSNIFEIQASQLAQEKSDMAPVKDFAQRMIDDHRNALDQLVVVAGQENFTPPVELDQQHQQKLEELRGLSGEEFGKRYVQIQIDAHRKAIELFTAEAEQGQNEQLRNFARETLPVLRAHFDQVMSLAREIGVAVPGEQGQEGEGEHTEINVEQAAPEITVQAPEPEVMVQQPQPEVTVQQPAPEMQVERAEPQVEVGTAEPQLHVQQDEGGAQIQKEDMESEVAAVTGTEGGEAVEAGAASDNPLYLLTAEELMGRTVVGATGEEIGDIGDIVLRRDDQDLYAVLEIGGFLGVGARNVAVPFDRLVIGPEDRLILQGMTKEQLNELPPYERTAYVVVERDVLLRDSL